MNSADLTTSSSVSKAFGVSACPLDPWNPELQSPARNVLRKGSVSWLKNTEVRDLLLHHSRYKVPVAREPPCKPAGGSIFLFDRKAVRFFRKDGHNWRKKADGKTVRETHEKLKVGNSEVLNCYYAHADQEDGQQLQRRAYWLLDLTEDKDLVLVHYLQIMKPSLAGNEPSDLPSVAPGSARTATPSIFQHPPLPGMPDDTGSASPSRASSPMQAQSSGPEPVLPGHSSGGSSCSVSPMMLDLQQPATSLPPPDPYMPLLPSMSLDSFFAAVDDPQGLSLRPLPSCSSNINLGPISLDHLGSAAELQPGAPMDSLTLSADLANHWQAPLDLAKPEEGAMTDALPANMMLSGWTAPGIHPTSRLSPSSTPLLGTPDASPDGVPTHASSPDGLQGSSGRHHGSPASQLAPALFPFPNLIVGALDPQGTLQPGDDSVTSPVKGSHNGHGTAGPALIYPMTSLDARAQGTTPGKAPLAGHVSRPVTYATLTGSGKAAAFEGAFARMLPSTPVSALPHYPQPGTGPQPYDGRRRSIDVACPSTQELGHPGAEFNEGRQHGAKRRSFEISRSGASPATSPEQPAWSGVEPLSQLAQLSDTVRRAASMGSVLSKASMVLSQQQKWWQQQRWQQQQQQQNHQQRQRQQWQQEQAAAGQGPWDSPARAFQTSLQLQSHPDTSQMQAEAASLKAQLASLQYPTAVSPAGFGGAQGTAAQPLPSTVLQMRYGGQSTRALSRATAGTPFPHSHEAINNAGQPSPHASPAQALIGSTGSMQHTVPTVHHGRDSLVPGSIPVVQHPATMLDPAIADAREQMVDWTREYRRQQAGQQRSPPQGGRRGCEQTLSGNAIPSVSFAAGDAAQRDSNSSGSKDSDGRAQRRFISPFALAAAPIGTEDDTDSDSRSASLPAQKCPSLTPTSSMTQPPATGIHPFGQALTDKRSGNMQLSSDEMQPGGPSLALSLGVSSHGSPPNPSGADTSPGDCRGQGSSGGPVPQGSIQELLVADYAPEWDFTTGGGKVLISGNFEGLHDPLFVLLDGARVPAQTIKPGTLKCIMPPHREGMVLMFVSDGSGSAMSKPLTFSYRAPQRLQTTPQAVCSGLRRMPAEEVQLRLIHLLIGARMGQVGSASALQAAQISSTGGLAAPASTDQDMLVKAFAGSQKKELLQTLLQESLQSFAVRAQSFSEHQAGTSADPPSPSAVANAMSLCAGLGYDWALRLLHPAAMAISQDVKGMAAAQDDWGCTPMQWAQARGQTGCAAALVALGAAHLDRLQRTATPPGPSWAATTPRPSTQPSLSSDMKLLFVSPTPERSTQPGDWSTQLDMQRKRSRHLFGDEVAAAVAGTDTILGQDTLMREQQDSSALQGPIPPWSFGEPS